MSKVLAAAKKNFNDPRYMAKTTRVMFNVFSIMFGIMFVLGEVGPEVLAAGGDTLGINMTGMFSIFKGLSNLFIKFAYGAMVLIFAVGLVKSGLTAQAAQQFGAAGKVSGELMNVLGGIVVFVFGILSYPLAEKIITAVIESDGAGIDQNVDGLTLPSGL
ncbi:MAG: hypothetical protein IJI14_15880 [Anaerolineaceae bacterium]|nr:hypothetical protein [Anaerolineaceae bacterium]